MRALEFRAVGASRMPQQLAQQPLRDAAPAGLVAVTAALAGGVAAAALRAARRQVGARSSLVSARRAPLIARRAEEEEEESGSMLDSLKAEDMREEAEKEAAETEMAKEEEEWDKLGEGDLDGTQTVEEATDEEAARRGERQITYDLYPSRQYVLYIAKKNAERVWTKDGPGGKNRGCIEVQIAILTERIRNMVIHVREFIHDYKCRLKLISLVSRRRRLLDKLSWKDLDSYIKVREALKIRHTYRLETLVGRLPAYKYAMRDRKQNPGKKVAMRLKKTKRLLNRRLAVQLRQGKRSLIIHKTRKKITSRKWLSRSYDDVENMISGKQTTEYVDPLNLP